MGVATMSEQEVIRYLDEINERPPINVLTAEKFLSMELPERELLMSPWLPAQGLVMVYAPRGIGKTFFALSVAYAIASGGEFLLWKAAKARKVLYIDGEMPANVMQERIRSIIDSAPKDADGDSLKIITPDLQGYEGIPSLSTSIGQLEIEKHLENVSLVIIDNISTLCRGGIENDAESWLPVQQWALKLRAKGISVLFVHHAGKGGQQRGTSRREDVLDTVINLKRPNDYSPEKGAAFEVHFEKSRGFTGEDAEPLEVELLQNENKLFWDWKKLEDSTYERVIELYQDGLKPAEIARELEKNRSTVSRHLKKAKSVGAIR